MNAKSYLSRIGYDGQTEPSVQTLAELHRAHVLSVPFENPDNCPSSLPRATINKPLPILTSHSAEYVPWQPRTDAPLSAKHS